MPCRKILVIESQTSPWNGFLAEFFEETVSKVAFAHDGRSALQAFDRLRPDMVFANAGLLSLALQQKLKVSRQGNSAFRLFHLGPLPKTSPDYDDSFEEFQPLIPFQKRLVQHLPLPDVLRVLIVDDEPEIGLMLRDFLENRVAPSFRVDYAQDGRAGLEAVGRNDYDVVVMDIKMPVMDGRELYREIRRTKPGLAVIVFFDAITGDEIAEIRESGWPAIVEKGAKQSGMPEMMALVKKMAYFG